MHDRRFLRFASGRSVAPFVNSESRLPITFVSLPFSSPTSLLTKALLSRSPQSHRDKLTPKIFDRLVRTLAE